MGRLLGFAIIFALCAAATPAPTPQADDVVRAACLKACAGAPRDATGKALLACLTRCDKPADAGVASP